MKAGARAKKGTASLGVRKMAVVIEFMHGLKITIPKATIYRQREVNGETVIVSDGTQSFVLFKGVRGYYLRSPRLFRKAVPVKFIYA